MKRLDFKLPEFTRVAWVSEPARLVWEHRIRAVSSAWHEIERSSVANGLRPGGLQNIEPDNLVRFQQWCLDEGLGMAIVGREGITPDYGNAAIPIMPNEPWAYRVYFGNHPARFAKIWGKDEIEVGRLLGYPTCCSMFFKANWVEAGWRDLIYPMIDNPAEQRIVGPYTCNILLRHIGVRPVFHLPCSFNCKFTNSVANGILEHGRMMGFQDEMRWLSDMLNWPARWSSLHGAAIVTTPILKITYAADALSQTAILDREGSVYPEEGAIGTEFPFRTVRPLQLQGLEDTWSDNGFSSPFAMRQAHVVILDFITNIHIGEGKVLDLGCGNGVLLEKIKAKYPGIIPIGVDVNEAKCDKTSARGIEVYWSDIARTDSYLTQNYVLTLISLNRLKELNADSLLSEFQKHTKFLLVYSYEQWDESIDLTRYFESLAIIKGGTTQAHVLRPR